MCWINPHKTLRWGKPPLPLGLTAVILVTVASAAFAGDAQKSTTSTNLLLIDRFGKPILRSTNEVPASLQPPASVGLGQQVPSTPKGAQMPEPLRERVAESKIGRQWFPTTPPVLMPYLAG